MQRRTFLIGVAALAACSPAAETKAPSPAASAADPAAIVRPIYDRYLPGAPEAMFPNLEVQAPWSASLKQAILDQEARFAAVTDADPEGIDFDVFVNAQDWQIADLNVTAENVTPQQRALVRARFNNGGAAQEVDYDMVWEEGAWRIDNMHSGGPPDGWDLRALVAK